MQMSPPQPLDASKENVTNFSDDVFFMKVAKFAGQTICEFFSFHPQPTISSDHSTDRQLCALCSVVWNEGDVEGLSQYTHANPSG